MPVIRVLHVIKTLGLGGAETNLFSLVQALDRGKVDQVVAYSSGGELESRFQATGIELFKFADTDHRIRSLATGLIVLKLARFMARRRIDVVHTHTFNAHIWGGLAAKMAGARILEHVHDFRYLDPADFVRRRGGNRQFWAVKYLKGFSDRVVVLTEQNREFVIRRGLYPRGKVSLVPNGLDLSRAKPLPPEKRELLRKSYGIALSAPLIVTPVRVAPEKNVDLIVRIVPQVLARAPDAVFVIAGDGPLLASFQSLVRVEGLERSIRFTGFTTDIQGLLGMADICLLPSFLELHSIALLEALSQACPVVISRGVGCHDAFIKHGVNGILLDPFSDAGWAEALIRLIQFPAERQAMGLAGLAICRELFDIRRTAASMEGLYEQLL